MHERGVTAIDYFNNHLKNKLIVIELNTKILYKQYFTET